ncbi:hypothetical protein [Mycobacterium sp. M23085]|uniref:Rv1733c family protein n=1 Tax=Mycobacterium sp. M23085 TaxID=3378087 RepID=UPI003877CC54
METFIWDPRCWQIARIFGRNPLLRRTDRVESLAVLVAIVVSLIAIPVAGIEGTAVYAALHSRYLQEANQRHAVVATVTATGIDRMDRSVVQASWPAAGGDRTGTVGLTTEAKTGQHVPIWIDQHGNPADPPTPTWRALTRALGTVMAMVLATGFAMVALVAGIRLRLDRARDAHWERAIRCFQENGGRANQR